MFYSEILQPLAQFFIIYHFPNHLYVHRIIGDIFFSLNPLLWKNWTIFYEAFWHISSRFTQSHPTLSSHLSQILRQFPPDHFQITSFKTFILFGLISFGPLFSNLHPFFPESFKPLILNHLFPLDFFARLTSTQFSWSLRSISPD